MWRVAQLLDVCWSNLRCCISIYVEKVLNFEHLWTVAEHVKALKMFHHFWSMVISFQTVTCVALITSAWGFLTFCWAIMSHLDASPNFPRTSHLIVVAGDGKVLRPEVVWQCTLHGGSEVCSRVGSSEHERIHKQEKPGNKHETGGKKGTHKYKKRLVCALQVWTYTSKYCFIMFHSDFLT